MQQYGEQLTQQVEHIRGATSDTGSEGGSSITRRFLNSVGGSSAASPNLQDSLNHSVGTALMEEVTEGDLLGLESSSRQRRLSGGSTHSTESSLSTLFQSVPGLAGTTLDSVDSDSETVDEYGSGVIRSATKDQISNVLSRLQGRASTYKDKYRDLVKKYNDVVTENNKCRTVLAQTQDKALDRIAKLKREKKALGEKLRELEESRSSSSPAEHKQHRLEEMLEKCKVEITKNRVKIKELTQENERLSLSVKAAQSESDISTLVADRVANEWKQRIDKVEEEWTERMNKNDADHAIQLATTKADMHAALETKDKEIESWRSKCRTLEVQDGQANERWQKKVDELQQVIQALEAEKGDMIEKLSAAKLQGVKAVRDEEEKKREELAAEFSEKEQRMQEDFERRLMELESLKEEEISQLKAEMESIHGVEGSLREAQDHGTSLSSELERLRSELAALDETKQKEVAELKDSLTSVAEKHRSEIAELMQEHDEIVSSTRKQQLIELEAMTAKFELAREEADSLRLKNDTLEKQLDQLDETYTLERTQAEEALQKQIDELCEKLRSQETAQHSQSEADMAGMRDSYSRLCETNDDLKRKLEEVTKVSVEQVAEAKQLEATLRGELDELRAMLESRNSEFHLIEIRKQELEEEIATARELSAMHDRLKAELEDTRKQRDEIEFMVASLTERAERAEKALQEDRALLMEERSNLEKSVEERKEKDSLIFFSSEDEIARKVSAHENMASVSDLSAQTAGEMCTSDEIQQLRSEIAYLNEMNTELTAKINHLEEENNTVKFTRDEAQRLLNELKTAGETVQGKLEVPDRIAGAGDDLLDVSMSAGDVQLENIRLNEELKRNVEEIIVVRNHRAALEKELLELKSQLAERDRKADNAEVFIPVQDENINEACGDKESRSDDSHHRISQLEEELQVQLKEVDCLSQAAANERRRAEKALEDVNEKLAQQEVLMNEIKQKDDVIARLEEEVKRVSTEEKAVRSQYADSENHCRQLESRMDEFVVELERLHEIHNEERARAESELTELRKLQHESESQIADLSEKLRISEETLSSKEQELELAKNNLNMQTVALENEISELKEKLKESTESAAVASERSTASLREVQNSLIEEEKRVLELRHKLKEEQAQLATLQSEAKHREEQLKNEISLRQNQEKVISDLREEIERIHNEHKQNLEAEHNRLQEAQNKIAELSASETEAKNLVVDIQAKLVDAEEKLQSIEKAREQEKLEEEKIREQYANALENSKRELEEAYGRVSVMEAAEAECLRLKKELDGIKIQYDEKAARNKEESETAIQDFKVKAEKKIAKIKAAAEKDVTSAKAELLLEVDQLRRSVSERDRRIDELVVEKARTEQQLIGQREMEEELEQRRLKEKELNDSRKSIERRIVELETENRLLEEKNSELVECKERSEARAEQSDKNLEELQKKIKTLEDANEEGFRKAAAKHDTDNKKAVRELQREVKQLYVELNEKTEALDEARARISELESSSSKAGEEAVIQKTIHTDVDASLNYGYEEELESMRRKLKDCHKEVDGLRETNSRLERLLEQSHPQPSSPAVINVNGGSLYDGMGFADPAEAEYLKNVLYRYMCSRENLGKEAVTLARVIGTVAKFSKSEMDNVISREESRVAGWVGGTVSHVLTGR